VTDDGCGISREAMEHLVEPFFTTKEVGRGTGLGLATVYGVVRQNHGFLQVQSEPGRGTAFWIFLPRLTGPIRTGASDPFAGAIRGGSETVLLVEDERALLVLARDLLQSLGYRVLTAAGAAEAIEVAREHGAGIDLLLTDVVMPRMNGRDLSVRLRSLIPNLKTLFMSGYAAETVVRDGLIQDHAHFLQKPFSIPALAEKVREALES
jgi:CheY-like chemotaxis protein